MRRFRIGTFYHERPGRKPIVTTYLRDYSNAWEGCVVYHVEAETGAQAKRIAQLKRLAAEGVRAKELLQRGPDRPPKPEDIPVLAPGTVAVADLRLTTCERCWFLRKRELPIKGVGGDPFHVWTCGAAVREFVVPHDAFHDKPPVFHHVPMQCFRPDSEVIRRPADPSRGERDQSSRTRNA